MKRLLVLGIYLTLMLTSCGSDASMSTKMNHLVGVMESNKHSWSSAQMQRCQQEFESLITTYELNREYYSPEERAAVQQAIDRYNIAIVSNEIDALKDEAVVIYNDITTLLEAAPEYIDKFTKEAINVIDTMDLKSLQSSIEQIGVHLEDAVQQIEQKIDEELSE